MTIAHRLARIYFLFHSHVKVLTKYNHSPGSKEEAKTKLKVFKPAVFLRTSCCRPTIRHMSPHHLAQCPSLLLTVFGAGSFTS
jgi:hypothetical protein